MKEAARKFSIKTPIHKKLNAKCRQERLSEKCCPDREEDSQKIIATPLRSKEREYQHGEVDISPGKNFEGSIRKRS